MAVSTMKLYAVEDAMVRSGAPDTSYHNNASVSMPYASQNENGSYFFMLNTDLGDAARKHILGCQVYIYVTNKSIIESGWSAYDFYIAVHAVRVSNGLAGLTYTNFESVIQNRYDTWARKTTPYSDVPTGTYWAAIDLMDFDANFNVYEVEDRINNEKLTFQGVMGANKPYLLLSMEDAELTIRPTPATGAYLNRHAAAKLTWALATNAYGGPSAFTQASAVLSWRNGASGAVNTIDVSGSEMAVAIPADTFPSTAELQWKVNVIFVSGETAESDWATLTTIDSTSSCALVSPVSTFIDGSVVNRFAWDHIIETGTAQSAYDLQYSIDNGATWTDIASAVAAENQYCDVPADTLPAGTLLWRVRTYNADGVGGTWSASATIVVQAAPAAPLITSVTATPRPEIAWQSSGQQAYQVTAGDYNSGHLYGTAKSFKVPVFLQDGPTDIAVRIQNSFGLWSSWARTSVTIANASPGGEIALTTASANNAVTLRWSEGAYKAYYVYRDGVPVARVMENAYVDRLAVGAHSYQVRGVEGEYYALSNTAIGVSVVRHAVIGAVNASDAWIPLECKRGGEPQHTIRSQATVAYHFYDGRKYPVADIAEFESVSDDLSFTLRAPEREAVMALVGKLVVYKDSYGALAIGILETVSTSVRHRSDTEFALHRVAYEEAVSYEI